MIQPCPLTAPATVMVGFLYFQSPANLKEGKKA